MRLEAGVRNLSPLGHLRSFLPVSWQKVEAEDCHGQLSNRGFTQVVEEFNADLIKVTPSLLLLNNTRNSLQHVVFVLTTSVPARCIESALVWWHREEISDWRQQSVKSEDCAHRTTPVPNARLHYRTVSCRLFLDFVLF